ncbi:hypothetical protein EDC04DRAFT_2908859 [Pisolithus marmoratus]|nr:hypothetical protein EDC04DRAFT_2908859 [Pisolithus marmoratus]
MHILQHMNQPSSACSAFLNDISHPSVPPLPPLQGIQLPKPPSLIIHNACQGSPEATSGMQIDFNDLYDDWMDIQVNGIPYNNQELDLQDPPGPGMAPLGTVKYFPGASHSYPSGRMFMDQFFSDKNGELHKENLFYPFASQEDWQIASWLLCSHLSMAAIDSFLSLDLIKQLPLSFQTAKELHTSSS